jgi:hypothetical protein
MIWKIGNTVILKKHKSTCHCGRVELQIELPNGIVDPGRCDCSICLKRGAAVAAVPLKDLAVVKGKEFLTIYTFNTKTAKHYFCSCCGIYTHHQSRLNPEHFDFNIGCLEGVNPHEIETMLFFDGVNHPCDKHL